MSGLESRKQPDWATLTAEKQRALEARASGHTMTDAAEAAGVTRQVLYCWRRDDAEFQAAWQVANDMFADKLEDTLKDCAAKAREDYHYQTSLIFSLKGERPNKFAERAKHEISGPGGGPIVSISVSRDDRTAPAGDTEPQGGQDGG